MWDSQDLAKKHAWDVAKHAEDVAKHAYTSQVPTNTNWERETDREEREKIN